MNNYTRMGCLLQQAITGEVFDPLHHQSGEPKTAWAPAPTAG